MNIKALKLKDEHFGNQWDEEVYDHWDYDDFKNNSAWNDGWISMDCAIYNKANNRVYLGITSFSNDIFRAYDRDSGKFVDLGYGDIADKYDAKFHRSLVRGNDGCLYAAIALLHDCDRYLEAPGSPIVKFDPISGAITKLDIPIPHAYIQSIVIDNERDMIYGQCLAPEYIFSFSIKTGETKILGLLGSGYGGMAQGENICLDDNGCVWFTWSLTRAWQSEPGVDANRLCKYDPAQDKVIFYQTGLPYNDGRHGFARPEAFFNFHDGNIYASGDNGSLYRINIETGEAIYLFTPVADRASRLSSMVKSADGIAYGVTGRDNNCQLLKVDYINDKYEILDDIKDEDGSRMWQCHDIVMTDDNVLYVCENDNPTRSSYLWEITL
jgi:hypothetical protein